MQWATVSTKPIMNKKVIPETEHKAFGLVYLPIFLYRPNKENRYDMENCACATPNWINTYMHKKHTRMYQNTVCSKYDSNC